MPMVSGIVGRFHKSYVRSVIPLDPGVQSTSAMTGVINNQGAYFFLDTHVQDDPTAEQIAEATLQATYRLRLFGIEPKVALLSHSNFGSHEDSQHAEDAQGARAVARAHAQAGDGWRDAGRHRLGRGAAPARMMPNSTLSPGAPTCSCCRTSMRPTSPTTWCG